MYTCIPNFKLFVSQSNVSMYKSKNKVVVCLFVIFFIGAMSIPLDSAMCLNHGWVEGGGGVGEGSQPH